MGYHFHGIAKTILVIIFNFQEKICSTYYLIALARESAFFCTFRYETGKPIYYSGSLMEIQAA